MFKKVPKNFDIGKIALVIDDVNAYIVASTWAGVSFASNTPGGKIINAKINVDIAVDEQTTQRISGTPIAKFHLSTKHISKKLEIIVRPTAIPIIVLGSVSLKYL